MTWVKGTSATNGTFNTTNGSAETAAVTIAAVGDVVWVAQTTATDFSGNPTTSNVVSSLGNTYTRIVNVLDATNHQRLELFLCVATVSGTDTLHPSFNPTPGTTTALAVTICADPFTGSDTSSLADGAGTGQNQVAPGTGTDAVTSGAFTTGTNGDLIYAATVDTTTGADPFTVGTGFTLGSVSSAATTIVCRSEYKTQSTAGSVAGTFTTSAGGSRVIAAVAAVKPATLATQLEDTLHRPAMMAILAM